MREPNKRELGCQAAPIVERRGLLTFAGLATLSVGMNKSALAHSKQRTVEEIQQPSPPGDDAFIERAFEMRQMAIDQGDQAYGAIIVRDGVIVGQSWSRVVLDQDPTAHAEMSAIRDAAKRLNSRDLSGAVIYSSSRPCPMCEAASFWAGLREMIYGRQTSSAGSPRLCR